MPISPFVANLRKKIGTDLLHLTGVSVVVLNDRREILLVHSKDTGNWMPIGGMIEPGEEPADAAVREVFEETGVHVRPERLVGVYDGPAVVYSNGDRVHYITLVFLCRAVSGEPSAHDDENHDAKYFVLDELPAMRADHARNVKAALADRPEAVFLTRGG
jgi:8-oxo-dGTP pyrophosphatase MutT (NUDIX family)